MESKTADTNLPIRSTSTKRTARACNACYTRKIKCDAVKPRCNWCSHHDLACVYERRVVRKKSRTSKVERAELLDRVDRLESLLSSTLARKSTLVQLTTRSSRSSSLRSRTALTGSAASTPSNASPARSSEDGESTAIKPHYTMQSTLGVLHFAGWRFGTVNLRNGLSVFSEDGQQWLRSRTGVDPSLDKIHALSVSWHQRARSIWGVSPKFMEIQPPHDLPDRQMVERYLDMYHHSFGCHIFPVVDPARFRITIEAAYSNLSAANEYHAFISQACIYAFLAFTSIINLHDETWPIRNGEEYAMRAHRLLIVYCMDTSIETLQAAVMINMFHLFSGNLQFALYQSSICARMVFTLGAHTVTYPSSMDPEELASNSSYRERYLLRNIFWVCYTMDKELVMKTGQPPCLQDQDCDLTLPPPHVQALYPGIMGYEPDLSYSGQHLFPGYPRLSILKSKTYGALYSVSASRKTDAELLRSIRELDDDLESWRLSLPPMHRPTFTFTRESLAEEASTTLGLMAHLDYNHCMAAIHQATGRCKAWATGQDDIPGVESSLALAVEASRSTLLYLQMEYRLVNDEVFWMVLYYLIAAVLTLFFSILNHPLEPQSIKDLELLRSIPGLIRRVPVQQLSTEKMQMQLIDELVNELMRLSECAVNKAQRESSARSIRSSLDA